MEDCSSAITAFCGHLRGLFSHLDSSCAALRNAVDRPPSFLPSQSVCLPSPSLLKYSFQSVSLRSPATSFADLPSLLTALVDRISSTSQTVKNLESLTVDTISFEELLGHCMEIYKQNERSICLLEDRLKDLGHAIPDNIIKDSEELSMEFVKSDVDLGSHKQQTSKHVNEAVTSALENVQNSFGICSLLGENAQLPALKPGKELPQCDSIYGGTVSLQDLGLSAAGLACLAQDEGSSPVTNVNIFTLKQKDIEKVQTDVMDMELKMPHKSSDAGNLSASVHDVMMLLKPVDENEYLNSPTWLKMQVSLEDLNKFVEDICTILSKKKNSYHTKGHEVILDQDDLSLLTGGDKMKPCLVFLVKLGRLRVGHENGAAVYHVNLE